MSRRRPLTLRPLRVLALLMLADRRALTGGELRCLVSPVRPVWQQSLRVYLRTLRAHGVRIESRHRGRRCRAYRVTEIPPDDVLDVLLPVMHLVKAELAARRATGTMVA
jgi:biotin operon repressor